MKTQDIRSMGLAYLEVLEGKDAVNKHGHDHVGKEDDDVNNDKKVDSTDKYLLNRRKAISANIRKEETEELDELSTKTTDSYWKKANKQLADPKTDLKTFDKRVSGVLTALKKDSKKTQTEETEEVDEALTGNQHKIDANKNGKVDAHDFHLLRNKKAQRALSSAKAQAKPKSAVSLAKTPWNEEVEEVEEVSNASKVFNKIAAKAGGGEKGKKMAAGLLNKMKKEEVELDEVSANTLGKYSIKAAQQGDKRVAGQKMADEKIRKKYGYSSDAKVAAEATEWTVFARIQEKAAETKKAKYEISNIGDDFATDIKTSYAKHTSGAKEHEPMDSKASQGEKDFVAMHGGLSGKDSGISADKNADLNSKAVRNSMKQAPGRHNDQKIGDKTPPKASA